MDAPIPPTTPYIASRWALTARAATETIGPWPGITVIPSLFRRCPECANVGPSRRFAIVHGADGARLVECPACGHRFRPVDDPRLN